MKNTYSKTNKATHEQVSLWLEKCLSKFKRQIHNEAFKRNVIDELMKYPENTAYTVLAEVWRKHGEFPSLKTIIELANEINHVTKVGHAASATTTGSCSQCNGYGYMLVKSSFNGYTSLAKCVCEMSNKYNYLSIGEMEKRGYDVPMKIK